MAIEVLLMSDVPNLGSEGEIVHVAEGHARNYLFPRKLAAPASDAMKKQLEKMRKNREEEKKAKVEAAQEMAKRLDKVSITISAKTGDDGKLFGSVPAAQILDALKDQGFGSVDKKDVELDQPIKELGVFEIKIRLHPEVHGTVKVWVVEE
ncbi:MAG: 50S ribosomal protein L9 [Verrucomicrobia bacterium]|nr:50S ribosomal protein L9 [Verrucomicrobiota bacterium]